jgi:hypothetical protein
MNKRAMIPGILLILIGVWFLLSSLGVEWLSMERLWPVILIIGGILSFVGGLREKEHDSGAFWFGIVGTLSGLVFLYITVGPAEWSDMAQLWPIFPAIAGMGWLAEWIFAPRAFANLALGLAGLLVGGVGFAFTYGALDPALGRQVARLWPLLLVLVGIGLVIQFLAQRKQ